MKLVSKTINPLKRGSAEQVRNILIGAEEYTATGGFSEPYYRNVGERLTLIAVKVLDGLISRKVRYVKNGKRFFWQRDLSHVAKLMTINMLNVVKDDLSIDIAYEVSQFLLEADENKDFTKAGDGMHQRFAIASEGVAGVVLQEKQDVLCLKQAILDGDIVLFDLGADRDRSAAQQVGNLAVQELASVFAELRAQNWHKNSNGDTVRMASVIIDEFAALGGEYVRGLFQRAR